MLISENVISRTASMVCCQFSTVAAKQMTHSSIPRLLCPTSVLHGTHKAAIVRVMILVGAIAQVMQKVLNTMVPRFLAQLAADYELWAAGDESRKPIGTGQL